jgi:MYXO-CTERM domain-containing protein
MASRFGRRLKVSAAAAALVLAASTHAQPDPRASLGEWSAVETWPASVTHAILLPTGKVLFFGEFEEGVAQYLWDPATGVVSDLAPVGYNIFCSGHSRLADGRVLFTGGHMDPHVGVNHASLFDPASLSWTPLPDMHDPRWYPTNTTLANGEVVVLSGEMDGSGDISDLPEIFDPATNTFRALDTAPMRLPYYPRCFVAPDGRVFCAGPAKLSRWLDPTGPGTWTNGPRGLYGDTATTREYGSAAMIGSKVYLFGGDDPPTATDEVIDLAIANPQFGYIAPMSIARRQHNAVIQPDGKVLVVGGSSGAGFDDDTSPVLYPELWDPGTDTWTSLAATTEYRGYHSTALLLPDGRILVAGGRFVHTAQIFSPPYLFRGARPRILAAPSQLAPAQRFRIDTPDGAVVQKVTLLRLAAVTHAFDQDQRFVELPFVQDVGAIYATAPERTELAPPGDYMIFLVTADGVPSVGQIVRFGPDLPDPVAVHATFGPAARGGCAAAPAGAAPDGGLALLAVAAALALARRRACSAASARR